MPHLFRSWLHTDTDPAGDGQEVLKELYFVSLKKSLKEELYQSVLRYKCNAQLWKLQIDNDVLKNNYYSYVYIILRYEYIVATHHIFEHYHLNRKVLSPEPSGCILVSVEVTYGLNVKDTILEPGNRGERIAPRGTGDTYRLAITDHGVERYRAVVDHHGELHSRWG